MADVKQAFGTVDSFTLTSLNSLATSATAGWVSAVVDNTTNLFLDYAVQLSLAAVNTAPANSKAFFLYVYSLVDATGTTYTTTGAATGGTPAGTVGTLTFPDITTNAVNMPLLGAIPYTGQNAVINSAWFSVSAALGDVPIPPKFGFALINHSGMTIAASGNALSGRGIYNTVI